MKNSLFLLSLVAFAVGAMAQIGRPLGMQSMAVPNSWLAASSCYEGNCAKYGPGRARLFSTAGSWASASPAASQWLQVTFPTPLTVGAIQLRSGSEHPTEWVSRVRFMYSVNGKDWADYRDEAGANELDANADATGVREIVFPNGILCRTFRVVVVQAVGEWNRARIQMELFTVQGEVWLGGQPIGISSLLSDLAFSASSANYSYPASAARLNGESAWLYTKTFQIKIFLYSTSIKIENSS